MRRHWLVGPGAALQCGDDLGAVLAGKVAKAGQCKADDGKRDEGSAHRHFLPVIAAMFL